MFVVDAVTVLSHAMNAQCMFPGSSASAYLAQVFKIPSRKTTAPVTPTNAKTPTTPTTTGLPRKDGYGRATRVTSQTGLTGIYEFLARQVNQKYWHYPH